MTCHRYTFLLVFLLLQQITATAQEFLKRKSDKALTFKEMQLQFAEWKSKNDLKSKKYWKSFKRWEMETQYHTDAQGNPVKPELFIPELLKAVDEKYKSKQSRSNLNALWVPSGPFNQPTNLTGYLEVGMGRINCIAFHPTNANTFFVGVGQGGVWKTTNGGQSWTPLTDNLPILRISDIAIDPINPNTMYISVCDFEYIDVALNLNGRKRNTHYGLGVYKTIDGGITWQPSGLTFQLTNGDASLIRKTIIHPTNTSHLIACGTSGMYASIDAGQTWTKTLDSLFWDLVQDPVNPSVLYAASGWLLNSNQGNAAIYKSTNFGQSWTMLNTGIPATGAVQRIKLAIAPSDPNYIYALTVDVNRGLYGFYTTTDAGTNWQYIAPALNILEGGEGNSPGGQGTYDLGLLVDAGNKNIVYAGGVNLWGSSDGAQSFNPISHWTTFYGPTTHADIHFLERQALTGNIFVCNDGGIYRTSSMIIHSWLDANNGIPWPTQWIKLNDGLQITSFYRLSSSKNVNGKLMAGAQDNSTYFYDGANWSNIFGGDGMDCYINPSNDSNIIGSSQYGSFSLSYDNGVSNIGCNPNVNGEVAEWTTPLIADYSNPGNLYAGFANVVKSTDYGVNWTALGTFPSGGFAMNEVSALAVAPSNGNVLYAAKRVRFEFNILGSVFSSTNGGTSWNDITAGLPDSLYYTALDVNDTNANVAYISMAGFSAGNKVFMTTNGGSSWQNISYNLPNLPINAVKCLPGGRKLLIATDIGVYLLEPNAVTWTNVSSDLPNVIVSDIELNIPLNKIYISTFGRGIWECDLGYLLSEKSITAASSDVKIFPVMNDGHFTIQLGHAWKGAPIQLEVIDIMGRIVAKRELTQASNAMHLELESGKYFLRMSDEKSTTVKSIVVN